MHDDAAVVRFTVRFRKDYGCDLCMPMLRQYQECCFSSQINLLLHSCSLHVFVYQVGKLLQEAPVLDGVMHRLLHS